jgi:Tol biopolymer transport system component
MTQDRSVDERISAWLLEGAPDQLPDRVLQATFERTRLSRQNRAFLAWRPLMNRITPTAFAVGAAAIVVIAIGVALLPRPNQSVGGPGPSPSLSGTPVPTTLPTPSLAPISLTGQIAFERTVDGNTDIYLMNLDRSGLVRLTDDPAEDAHPNWSSDGKSIVFIRGSGEGRDVYVMKADGSGVTRLTTSPEGEDSAAFSPDDSEIAFSRYVDPAFFDLYVMAADGSGERRIFHKDGSFTCCPVWSVDGQALLFNEDDTSGGAIDVVRLQIATGVLTRITNEPGDDSSFVLSPDGSTIAFQSDRAPGGIFLMDLDGSNVRHVTGSWMKGYPLSWSPDGEHLVYSQPDGWLYLVRTDGTEITKWTQGGPQVAWRPGS